MASPLPEGRLDGLSDDPRSGRPRTIEDDRVARVIERTPDAGFDPNDRKFAALAKRERIPAINAMDRDWLDKRKMLAANGIRVEFLCGCDAARWHAA